MTYSYQRQEAIAYRVVKTDYGYRIEQKKEWRKRMPAHNGSSRSKRNFETEEEAKKEIEKRVNRVKRDKEALKKKQREERESTTIVYSDWKFIEPDLYLNK